MLSSPALAFLAVACVAVFIFAYAAYWAFVIRRSLAIRLYRNQALGIGMVALSWGVTGLVFLVLSSFSILFTTHNPFRNASLSAYIALLAVYYWTDASTLASRRSDPQLRNTLHWNKLRRYLWVAEVISTTVVIAAGFGLGFSPMGLTKVASSSVIDSVLFTIVYSLPFLLTGLSSVAVLPLISRRSGDVYLRSHLRWFGIFCIFLLFAFVINRAVSATPLGQIEYLIPIIFASSLAVGAYCLYKSAKSLVPLNRILQEVPK